MNKKVAIISLGCDKNRVDTESMLFYLSKGGYECTADFDEAQIILVNTCAFIASARQEAIDNIFSAARYKRGKCEKLIVTGCLPQKYRSEIVDDLPEVDAFLGINEYATICDVIDALYQNSDMQTDDKTEKLVSENADKLHSVPIQNPSCSDALNRIVTTPAHYAYLRIADGCDNHCTFCTIPSIRGVYRSRSIESLIAEAESLIADGVQELILVAQDVTRYGTDLYQKSVLVDLIRALSRLDITWIRLMYCYPELVTDELIAEIDNNPKVAKYVDIPLQHVDDTVLKRMNRRSTYASICALMDRIRAANNHIAVRTTVMVGFPGETEAQFNKLADFLSQYKPEHVGVFAYSKEEDTPSAKLSGHLTKKLKMSRVEQIGRLHYRNCIEHNQLLVGKTLRVLYEDIDFDKNLFRGRTQYNAPEIDTDVYFTAAFADVGNFYDVIITDIDNYDLIGESKQHELAD